MRNIRTLLLATAVVLISAKAAANEQCVSSMADLDSAPEIKRLLVGFGGHEHLAGDWKLSGLAGSFVSAKVKFENRGTSFWTQYNNEPASQIQVCTHTDNETLKLVIIQPLDPRNQYIYVKPVPGKPDRIMLAAHASDNKFVKFKKIQSIRDEQ